MEFYRTYLHICLSLLIKIRERYNNDSGCYFQGKQRQPYIWAETASFSGTTIFGTISLCIEDAGMSQTAVHEAQPQALTPYFRIL